MLYAISVLTHLDESMQIRWLEDWRRIVRPGGVALVTYHGEDFVENTLSGSSEYYKNILDQQKEKQGFAFIDDKAWSGIFPEFYQTAYHHTRYIKEVWSKYFDIIKIYPSGEFVNKQNVALLMRRPN
jgi:hypothetical protein